MKKRSQDKRHINRLKSALERRTQELAATHRQLRLGKTRHQAIRDTSEKNRLEHKTLLEESLTLQKRLRQLTHRVLAAQEDQRMKISRELQDEIVQTLLGINVRLLSLKQESRLNTKGIKNEIANTQRIVLNSAKSVRRVAREISRS